MIKAAKRKEQFQNHETSNNCRYSESVFPKLGSADPSAGNYCCLVEFREKKCVHFCIQLLLKSAPRIIIVLIYQRQQ